MTKKFRHWYAMYGIGNDYFVNYTYPKATERIAWRSYQRGRKDQREFDDKIIGSLRDEVDEYIKRA